MMKRTCPCEYPQVEREDHAVGQAAVAPLARHELEALQVQREHVWQPLDPHAALGLLQRDDPRFPEIAVW